MARKPPVTCYPPPSNVVRLIPKKRAAVKRSKKRRAPPKAARKSDLSTKLAIPGKIRAPRLLMRPQGEGGSRMAEECGRRIQARMTAKGWKQTDLARAASKLLPRGVKIGRDIVSKTVRGKSLPLPRNLVVFAKALDCDPEDLQPPVDMADVPEGTISFSVRRLSDGRFMLNINRTVSEDAAFQIQMILRKEDK